MQPRERASGAAPHLTPLPGPGEAESAHLLPPAEPHVLGAEDLVAPSGRSAGGDILAGLRALTSDPLMGVGRAAGRAVSSALPQGLKDGLNRGAEGLKDGLLSGASAVRGAAVRTGDAIAAVVPEIVKDGFKAGAQVAQRGAEFVGEGAVDSRALRRRRV